jgi:hypothetical protein
VPGAGVYGKGIEPRHRASAPPPPVAGALPPPRQRGRRGGRSRRAGILPRPPSAGSTPARCRASPRGQDRELGTQPVSSASASASASRLDRPVRRVEGSACGRAITDAMITLAAMTRRKRNITSRAPHRPEGRRRPAPARPATPERPRRPPPRAVASERDLVALRTQLGRELEIRRDAAEPTAEGGPRGLEVEVLHEGVELGLGVDLVRRDVLEDAPQHVGGRVRASPERTTRLACQVEPHGVEVRAFLGSRGPPGELRESLAHVRMTERDDPGQARGQAGDPSLASMPAVESSASAAASWSPSVPEASASSPSRRCGAAAGGAVPAGPTEAPSTEASAGSPWIPASSRPRRAGPARGATCGSIATSPGGAYGEIGVVTDREGRGSASERARRSPT